MHVLYLLYNSADVLRFHEGAKYILKKTQKDHTQMVQNIQNYIESHRKNERLDHRFIMYFRSIMKNLALNTKTYSGVYLAL